MFKEGDLVTIDSETSKYNGSCCKVLGYTNRKCKDIIKVQLEENHIIQVRDYSLKYTTVYDIIRKMSDSELEATMPNEILENIKEKYLSKEENN